jgi:hypothetical protein
LADWSLIELERRRDRRLRTCLTKIGRDVRRYSLVKPATAASEWL